MRPFSPMFLLLTALIVLPAPLLAGQWAGGYHLTGVDGESSDGVHMNGNLYVGGDFRAAGPVPAEHVARFDGAQWHAVGDGLPHPVDRLVVHDGLLVAAVGWQETDPPTTHGQLWAWDGVAWAALTPALDHRSAALASIDGVLWWGSGYWTGDHWEDLLAPNGTVAAIVPFAGEVLFAGDFYLAGGVATGPIAAWDGVQIHAAFPGLTGAVDDLEIGTGQLVAMQSTGIRRWTFSGWEALGSFYEWIQFHDLATHADELYLTSSWEDIIHPWWEGSILRWDGSDWVTAASHFRTRPGRLTSWNDDLIVLGRFDHGASEPCANVARIGPAGFEPIGPVGQGFNGSVHALDVGPQLAVGGAYWVGGCQLCTGAMTLDDGGWHARSIEYGYETTLPYTVYWYGSSLRTVAYPWTDIIDSYLLEWTGTEWAPVIPEHVESRYPEGAAVVYGQQYIWNYYGIYDEAGLWSGDPIWTFSGHIIDLDSWQGGLVAAGLLWSVDGVDVENIALYRNGGWQALGGETDGRVHAVQEWNGLLVAGGRFEVIGGVPAVGLAAWDGVAWQELGGGVHGTAVNALEILNGRLVVGGDFDQVGAMPASNLATFDGQMWYGMGGGTDDAVYALAADGDELFVGGRFTLAGDVPSARFARWTDVITTAPDQAPVATATLALSPPSPNPFNPTTTLAFTVDHAARVQLRIYDARGRLVRTLLDEARGSGTHRVTWHGDDDHGRPAPSGAYLMELRVGDRRAVQRGSLVK